MQQHSDKCFAVHLLKGVYPDTLANTSLISSAHTAVCRADSILPSFRLQASKIALYVQQHFMGHAPENDALQSMAAPGALAPRGHRKGVIQGMLGARETAGGPWWTTSEGTLVDDSCTLPVCAH